MPVTIATVNVNGVRAAAKKGFIEWVAANRVDILALQEVRAETEDLLKVVAEIGGSAADGGIWHVLHDAATAKGRAGVALLSKLPPKASRTSHGADDFDSAGRWLEGDYEFNGKTVTVVSTYVHAGEVDTPKQIEKYKFLDAMIVRMGELAKAKALAVVVGDLNVGHTELDIKNWKGNLKNSGFLPEERAYFDRFMGELGWVDIGRAQHPEEPGPYTWWSMRGQAFDTDTGWRIDYQLATSELAALAKNYRVHRAPSYAERWTDHSPVLVDYIL
ncbi:MAG: exodeoxyribonuclease III [Actinomycetes bacterium]